MKAFFGLFRGILFFGTMSLLVACGGEKSSSGPGDSSSGGLKFSCGSTECSASSQYCLKTLDKDEKVVAAECFARPEGCNSCGKCLVKDGSVKKPGICYDPDEPISGSVITGCKKVSKSVNGKSLENALELKCGSQR